MADVLGDFFFVPGWELVLFKNLRGASPAAVVLFHDEGNAVAGAEEVMFLIFGENGGGIVNAFGVTTAEILGWDEL